MLTKRLLDWYADSARVLPWRIGPKARARGERPDPYRVWLSEVMLQQTTIPHGTRYFLAFTERWPTVQDLAAAEDGDVMAAWAGLGYYARARNLLKCAREVTALGAFPNSAKTLQALPGIGPYTAGAIAAIAFDQPAAAVDGNVERVMSRILAAKGDWATVKTDIRHHVSGLVPEDRPGEFAEALMDLGATVCLPRNPSCGRCPLREMCQAYGEGTPAKYPIKPRRRKVKTRYGGALIMIGPRGVKLIRRPEKGLLGGMLALPSTDWGDTAGDIRQLCREEAGVLSRLEQLGTVHHVFTHFALELDVYMTHAASDSEGLWVAADDVTGLPSVFAKAFRLAYPSKPISVR